MCCPFFSLPYLLLLSILNIFSIVYKLCRKFSLIYSGSVLGTLHTGIEEEVRMLRGDQDINVGRKDDHLPGSHLYARKEAATSFHNLFETTAAEHSLPILKGKASIKVGSSELELGEPAQPNGEETCDKMGREEKGPPTEHNKRSSSSAVVETTPSGGFHAELIGLTGGCYFCDANVPQAPDKDKSTKEAFSICDSFDYDMNNDKFWEEAFILD